MPEPRRVGLFGGSFDPVHLAHLALARAARDQLGLDELRWIPAGAPWQKARDLAPAADREAMVRLAIAGEPRFVLDPVELRRDGPTYTVDTVRAAMRAEPATRFFLVLGEDQHSMLHTWRDWPELVARVTLAVADRPGVDVAPEPRIAALPHVSLQMPPTDVSSTAIRRRIAANLGWSELVPVEVASYIAAHGLYRRHEGGAADTRS